MTQSVYYKYFETTMFYGHFFIQISFCSDQRYGNYFKKILKHNYFPLDMKKSSRVTHSGKIKEISKQKF